MIDWLLSLDTRLLPLMQFAASTMLTLAGFVVGLAALNFSYRNNFGWAPIVLFKSYGVSSGGAWIEAHCTFEVWNRRKYPIVVREMHVSFGDTKIVDDEARHTDGVETEWYATSHGNLSWRRNATIEPSQHMSFEALGPIRDDRAMFNNRARIEIMVDIFDPRKNGHLVLKVNSSARPSWFVALGRKRRLPVFSTTGPVRRRMESIGSQY